MFLHKPTNVQRLMAADLQGGGEPSDEERAEERRKWDEIAVRSSMGFEGLRTSC